MEGAVDPGTTVRTSGINTSITFSLMEKYLENSRERFSVNRFATRKDKRVLAHNCSGSPGVSHVWTDVTQGQRRGQAPAFDQVHSVVLS